jgi:hypothetical protein
MFGELHPFRLSWSRYLVLMRMKNADQRQFGFTLWQRSYHDHKETLSMTAWASQI